MCLFQSICQCHALKSHTHGGNVPQQLHLAIASGCRRYQCRGKCFPLVCKGFHKGINVVIRAGGPFFLLVILSVVVGDVGGVGNACVGGLCPGVLLGTYTPHTHTHTDNTHTTYTHTHNIYACTQHIRIHTAYTHNPRIPTPSLAKAPPPSKHTHTHTHLGEHQCVWHLAISQPISRV